MIDDVHETRYVKTSDGLHIAYQVVGSGPVDLVFEWGWGGNVETEWEWPAFAGFLERLASFCRLIRFDTRGTGLSDATPGSAPALEDHARDTLAVLDAVDAPRAALFANSLAGLPAMFFAATHPERTAALVLDGCYPRFSRAPDYPAGISRAELDRALASLDDEAEQGFHGMSGLRFLAPTIAHDREFERHALRRARTTNSPAVGRAVGRFLMETDVRPLLGSIRAPTLVLYRRDDRFAGKDHAEQLAARIDGARLVELPGRDNLSFVGDTEALIGEVQEFLTGARSVPELDRVLATVLFTDIVRSTDRIAEIGDRRWRELLDRHDDLVAQEVERFRGRFVKSTGDGVVATFDGPARAIRCAQVIAGRTTSLGLEVRSGVHTGEIELRRDDLSGIAVHVAQRVCSLAGANEVLVSRTVVDLVAGSGIEFEDHGDHELKGVPGTWRLFRVPV